MKDLLLHLVQAIVEKPDAIVVDEQEDENGRITFTVTCDVSDRGLVIGKRGRNINAIRTIIKIMAVKLKKFVNINLQDDGQDGQREHSSHNDTPSSNSSSSITEGDNKSSDDNTTEDDLFNLDD